MVRGRPAGVLVTLGAVAALAACDPLSTAAPRTTAVTPVARPAAPAPRAKPRVAEPTNSPSEASLALAAFYTRLQEDLLVRGLLRTDGGGPDTLFTDTILARNFETIALEEEYVRGAGLEPAPQGTGTGTIKKWLQPVRVQLAFGTRVPQQLRSDARTEVASYVTRLARATSHPISLVNSDGNFHVLFVGEDDRGSLVDRVQALVPQADLQSLQLLDRLPRDIHCLVIAFASEPGGNEYGEAVALIRAEHPDLLRRACIHEELAQGLGLANDSPRARPSIFNDDDEFALLTAHDELLLRMLYDARLTPGMSAPQARPIIQELATTLAGSNQS